MRRSSNTLLRIAAGLAAISCVASSTGAGERTLTPEECRLESAHTRGVVAARCYSYAVRENRDDAKSKELRIHAAVVPALRLRPKADPLFILSGGPGQAASDFYLSVAPAFARIRRDRDIVLVDQRGTGRSNRLQCELPDESELAAVDMDELRGAVRDCLARLSGDPRYYTTSVAVRDLDEIRAALGYESISLYGVSYGTRVAQHYMRRYPRRVRAAVLDGVVPPDAALGPDVALASQRALDAMFERCAADASCKAAFPDIAERFAELRSRLRASPLHVSIPDPVSAQPVSAALGELQLIAAVRLLMYTDETASVLPLLINEAREQRPQALAAQYQMIRNAMEAQIAQGMHFAVVCSEDAPRWERSNVSQEALAQTYMGAHFMDAMRTICEAWPRGPVDEDFGELLTSDIPTLILSGEVDPATPASYAEQIRPGLKNHKHLVLAGQGHGQIGTGCVPRLTAQFIDAASPAAIDEACTKQVSPAPFMLSLTAPAP